MRLRKEWRIITVIYREPAVFIPMKPADTWNVMPRTMAIINNMARGRKDYRTSIAGPWKPHGKIILISPSQLKVTRTNLCNMRISASGE